MLRNLQRSIWRVRRERNAKMTVTIFNRKYNDEIHFTINKLTEEKRIEILEQVRSRGWEDKDCWSEVKE